MAKPQIDLKFGADLKDFRRGISNIDHSLRRLSGGFGALGGVIGASFAVDAIRQFVSESVELGSTMEGVRGAFERFADPKTLTNLREAVAGTVDDLKLMQMAVRAKNFKIPMDVLAKGLKFATQRAVETGESVDYLVESFVIGLGRESVKILDNLGISTLEIQKKTKEVGDMTTAVGMIMDEEFSRAGERVETTSMKIDQQRAAITNLKTEIGEQLAPTYSKWLSFTTDILEDVNSLLSDHLSFVQKIQYFSTYLQPGGEAVRQALIAVKETNEETEKFAKAQDKATESTTKATSSTAGLVTETKKHNEQLFMAGESMREYIRLMNDMSQTAPMAFATVTQASEQFVTAGQKMQTAFMGVSDAIGNTLAQSFEAALMNGEGFFKTFIEGLKAMVAQLLATIAAAAVLALVLTLATGGLSGLSMQSFGTAFGQIGGGMGVPSFAMPGGLGGGGGSSAIEIFGRLSGSDILLSGERASRNRSRSRGF